MARIRSNSRGRLIGAAVVALAALTGACTSPPQTADTRAATSLRTLGIAPGEGLLVLKLAINRPQVSPFFRKFMTVVVWNDDLKKEFVLKDYAESWASHASFAASLPPGRYTFRTVNGDMSNPMQETTLRGRIPDTFPGFGVAAGRVTDLGTLAFAREHAPALSTRHAWGQVDAPHDLPAQLAQLTPAAAAALSGQPALGWETGPRLQALQQNYQDMRSASMLAYSPVRMPDGALLLGEAFGQIGVRTPRGEWRVIDTPTATPIRALHAAADGSLFAGSEDSLLLALRAGRDDWETLPLPVADGIVIHVGPMPGSLDLLVILQTRDRFVGLSGGAAGKGPWAEQFSQPRQLFKADAADARGFVLRSGDNIVLATGSNLARNETVRYDHATRSWIAARLESDGVPICWTMLPDGRIARFEQVNLSRDRFFNLSSDGGVHWERRAELHETWGALLFVTNEIGYVVRAPGPPLYEYPEATKQGSTVWRTDDAGRTWRQTSPAPGFPRSLVQLGGPDSIGFVTDDGRFFGSQDGGKTWKLEREVP